MERLLNVIIFLFLLLRLGILSLLFFRLYNLPHTNRQSLFIWTQMIFIFLSNRFSFFFCLRECHKRNANLDCQKIITVWFPILTQFLVRERNQIIAAPRTISLARKWHQKCFLVSFVYLFFWHCFHLIAKLL